MESHKIAFAIYRESVYRPQPKVVYFTELDEKRRDLMFAEVMNGEILWDGLLIDDARKPQAKAVIAGYLEEIKKAGEFSATDLQARLQTFLA